MIPRECKRLAEVDFPIAVVSKHAAREKSIRHGHPSTLHLWWARRPLASCRAMLLGLLLPDPCDAHCPTEFKEEARQLLAPVQGTPGATDEDLRRALLRFIGDFADWDKSAERAYLEASRGLVKAAHLPAGRQAAYEPPLVADPFAGGGSIPLEALRLGCEAFASDLNPVACLILKVLLEDIPRHGPGLAEELRRVGAEVKAEAEKRLAELYPLDRDGSRPIAYFWARTVRCESPHCGAELPLVSTFWLSKKASHRRALRPLRTCRPGGVPCVDLEPFEPCRDGDVSPGTARNGRAQCPCCGSVIPPARLQKLLSDQRGGVDVQFNDRGERVGGARLLAVAYTQADGSPREYRTPRPEDYYPVRVAQLRVRELLLSHADADTAPFPDEPVNPIRPSPNARGLSAVTRYGVQSFGDLFNARQKLSLHYLAKAIEAQWLSGDGLRRQIAEILGAALGKRADYSSGGTRWHLTFEKATCTFSKQALSQTWDYVEPTAIGSTSGSYGAGLETVIQAVEVVSRGGYQAGETQVADARGIPLPDNSVAVWFTDPPYYDAIPYADLSDFFFVWLKRALRDHGRLQAMMDEATGLTPKREECVWNQSYRVDGAAKNGEFFEECVAEAFLEARRVLVDEGIGSVVFAHKTTQGWEALLSGLVRAGWVITNSWPLAKERAGRLQSQNSAALATSVHLVCRPRSEGAEVGEWSRVVQELPVRVREWMGRLEAEGIRGADLVFACIGPALEIFSRYSKVVDAEDREIPLGGDPEATEPHRRGFLAYVWEAVGRVALQQVLGSSEATARNSAAGALEEDARLTALFLWTLQSSNGEATEADSDDGEDEPDEDEKEAGDRGGKSGFRLVFDVVRRFAQPLGIHLDQWEGRIIEIEKGVVRLLSVPERAKQLFGQEGAEAVADRIERGRKPDPQLWLFPDDRPLRPARSKRGRRGKEVTQVPDEALQTRREATTLDRVHAAMLLQADGRANALRALLAAEQQRAPDFLRLANALSALYPSDSEEKRLLDAMLLAVPR